MMSDFLLIFDPPPFPLTSDFYPLISYLLWGHFRPLPPPQKPDIINGRSLLAHLVVCTKGQLISKQDCRAINSPKKQTISTSKFTTSRLVQKRVYVLAIGRSYSSTILFRD